MWDYRAVVIEVHDGDTMRVLIDQGFGGRQEEMIRLLGVSAPELSQPGGSDATQFVKAWVDRLDKLVKWPIRLATVPNTNHEPEEKRTFTRYLGTLYSLRDGTCLNEDINAFLATHPEWGKGIQ